MPSKGLPVFTSLDPRFVLSELEALIATSNLQLYHLSQLSLPTFDNFVLPIERMDAALLEVISPSRFLNKVRKSKTENRVYEHCEQIMSEFYFNKGQNRKLFEAYLKIEQSEAFKTFTQPQKKIVQNAILDSKLVGVNLPAENKHRVKQLINEIADLGQVFKNNIIQCNEGWAHWVNDETLLQGLSEDVVAMAKKKADEVVLNGWPRLGIYLFGLDHAIYSEIITYASNRDLRRIFYEAQNTRASEVGPHNKMFDNTPIIQSILQKRHTLAQVLGFKDYVEYSLADKMARHGDTVVDFLLELAKKIKPHAEDDMHELKDIALRDGVENFEAWDFAYYSALLKEEKFENSDEEMREYFPLDTVLAGMFDIVNKLFRVFITEVKGVDVWEKDVRFFKVTDDTGETLGQFYLDPISWSNKKGGAWTGDFQYPHYLDAKKQPGLVYVVTRTRQPLEGEPVLLKHNDVITLFHEFGHALHRMLTEVKYPSVAGRNGVPLDACELPSQFMENFCWQEAALVLISGHYLTKETLPPKFITEKLKSMNFLSASRLLSKIESALIDINLHKALGESGTVCPQSIIKAVRSAVLVFRPPEFERIAHTFDHIFTEHYAAGRYCYLWADVLASDAFARLEEEGLFNQNVGMEFRRTVLGQGGTRDPLELFVEFRGRTPNVDAMLKQNGLNNDIVPSAPPKPRP